MSEIAVDKNTIFLNIDASGLKCFKQAHQYWTARCYLIMLSISYKTYE